MREELGSKTELCDTCVAKTKHILVWRGRVLAWLCTICEVRKKREEALRE